MHLRAPGLMGSRHIGHGTSELTGFGGIVLEFLSGAKSVIPSTSQIKLKTFLPCTSRDVQEFSVEMPLTALIGQQLGSAPMF
jgi:hypothetical protein